MVAKNSAQGSEQPAAGIVADAVYTLASFERITGLKKDARRTLVSKGLVIRKLCGRLFICGSDFLEFVKAQANAGYDAT